MKLPLTKLLAAVIAGILYAAFVYDDSISWSQRGKDAWLAHQAIRFDENMSHPTISHVIIYGVMLTAVFLLCEVLAEGLKTIFEKIVSRKK